MKIKTINWMDWLFVGTILFFLISLVNISFALLGLICMITPFVMYFVTGKKIWCTSFCPRASLFVKFLSKISLGIKVPKGLFSQKTKRLVLMFFCINLIFIFMSTTMVYLGRINPIEHVRFLILFQIPLKLPQLIYLNVPEYVTHLGYRIFSIMFSSTVVGMVMGILFKPRAWCAICPIQTLTSQSIKVN